MDKDGLSTIRVKADIHRKVKEALKENNLGPMRTMVTEFLKALYSDPKGTKAWLMQKNYGAAPAAAPAGRQLPVSDADISGELLDILSNVENEINGDK